MANKFIKLGGSLIALYLLVAYASGSGRVISTSASGASNVIKAFQGR